MAGANTLIGEDFPQGYMDSGMSGIEMLDSGGATNPMSQYPAASDGTPHIVGIIVLASLGLIILLRMGGFKAMVAVN